VSIVTPHVRSNALEPQLATKLLQGLHHHCWRDRCLFRL